MIEEVEQEEISLHSFDPRGRPTVTTGNDHYFHMMSVLISQLCKISQSKLNSSENHVSYRGVIVGQAVWIFDDTDIVYFLSFILYFFCI